MNNNPQNTPVLVVVFNRPEMTRQVFEVIRQVRPLRLYISADGPRASVQDDIQKCSDVRKIFENIDWECKVETNYSESNLGCRTAVVKAIDWFFDKEVEGIILEDDCLPSESFFRFCAEILEKYRDDERIMHINGNNFGTNEYIESNYSYHFSSYGQVWGWATWSRAWDLYQRNLVLWPRIKKGEWLRNMDWSIREFNIQTNKYDRMTGNNPIDTWDYQWHFTLFINNGLAVTPKTNFISNIGYGSEATHTREKMSPKSEIPIDSIGFPLCHPEFVRADYRLDAMYRRMMIQPVTGNIISKIWRFLRRLV